MTFLLVFPASSNSNAFLRNTSFCYANIFIGEIWNRQIHSLKIYLVWKTKEKKFQLAICASLLVNQLTWGKDGYYGHFKVIFGFGKWVLQHYVFIFVSYCTWLVFSLLPYVYLLQIPLKTVCTGYNGNEEDNSNENSDHRSFRQIGELTHFQHVQAKLCMGWNIMSKLQRNNKQ